MSITKFKEYYEITKNNLIKIIEEYNNHLIEEDNSLILENLNYFKELNSDGKLIRGTLVNLGYSFFKKDIDYSYKLALAYEVFQTAILVHDDIIDKDNKRRGKDTVHYSNYKKYIEYSDSNVVSHLSNSIALCIGDYGLFQANKIIADSYQNDANLGKVISYFNQVVLDTIRGEILDVVLPFQSRNVFLDKKELESSIINIYRLKTAYYTIVGPLVTGMLLGGSDSNKVDDITKIGEKIGIAFQIQDDILGIFGQDIGKVIASDIREYKQTILFSYTINTKYKDELLKYYGLDDLNEEKLDKVKDIFKDSGALDYATDKMDSLYNEGIKEIRDLEWLNEDKKDILIGLVEYLKKRHK